MWYSVRLIDIMNNTKRQRHTRNMVKLLYIDLYFALGIRFLHDRRDPEAKKDIQEVVK